MNTTKNPFKFKPGLGFNRLHHTIGSLKLLILLFAFSFISPLYSQTKEHHIVEKIEVIFTPKSPTTKMELTTKGKLKTKEGAVFSQTTFDNDLKMLVQDFDRVDPSIEVIDGKISITLKISEKPLIKNILWEGNHKLTTSSLESELGIHKGAIFDRKSFNEAFHNVKTYYVKKGFFEAQLNYSVIYKEASSEVDILIKIEEGRAGKIKSIVFSGFTKPEQNTLAEMMVTKEYNFFLSWLTGEGVYNEEMIQHDKFIVLNYLHNHGYADAKVQLNVCETQEHERIVVQISVERGPRYHFGSITIEGNHLFCTDEILKKIRIREGVPFSPEQIHDSLEAITNLYGKSGYIEAIVNYEPKLSCQDYVYDLNITIDEGEAYLVGMIKVIGNCTTQTKVILHETLLIPGEVFNLQKLQLTEARLRNIGYFKNVNVYAVKTDSCSVLPGNYRDVHIEVEETNTGHLGASFGFSSDESLFGGINLTERNFNAKGLKHFWSEGFRALRGGGEYFHINLTFGSRASSYGLSWTKPYFRDTPWSVGFDLEKSTNQYITDDYEIKTYGLTLHANYVCNAFVRFGTHYRLKYADIDIEEDEECDCKDPEEKKKCEECKALKKQARNDGLVSAVGLTWMYDSTDNPMRPTRGLKSRVEAEMAGLGGKRSFFSVDYLNSYYYNFFDYGVFKFRADVRFIQPFGSTSKQDIPLDERFFLGGDSDVRGYRPYRLGPKFCNNKDDPEGGISMQLFSAEFCKPLFSRADGFIFYDAGSVTMKTWHFGHLFQSAGFGARLKIFEGTPPLTLGMGYPINPDNNSDVKKFFISVGGKF